MEETWKCIDPMRDAKYVVKIRATNAERVFFIFKTYIIFLDQNCHTCEVLMITDCISFTGKVTEFPPKNACCQYKRLT